MNEVKNEGPGTQAEERSLNVGQPDEPKTREKGRKGRKGRKGQRKGLQTRTLSVARLAVKRAIVLRALADGYTLERAAKRAGYCREWLRTQRKNDAEFARAVEGAIDDGTDRLEDVLAECAANALRNPRHQTSLIFFLKNRRPKQWRDRVESDIQHGPQIIEIVDATSPSEQEKSRFSAETTVPSKVEGTAIDTRADAAKQAGPEAAR
jgi:hypothetical protein